jgi:hypothetical protein
MGNADDEHIARVPRDIADLIPEFRENRRRELAKLRKALKAGNFQLIGETAHRMIGVGSPYGFDYITSHARLIREGAAKEDSDTIQGLLDDLEAYLARVRVVFE